jgi:hypothetical protein
MVNLLCPECQRRVFKITRAMVAIPEDSPQPYACEDMGHWVGYRDQCKDSSKYRVPNPEDE